MQPPFNSGLANIQKLQFYGLFKQATIGDINTSRPSFFDFVGQKKWYHCITYHEALRIYIKFYMRIEGIAGKLTKVSRRKVPLEHMFT